MCFSHKIKCQVPYEFTFTNALGVLYHYPLHYMYMTLKDIFNLSNNTYRVKVFHNEIWGKISYYPVLPSTAISGSIAQPRKTRVFPPGFSRAVNILPTLMERQMDGQCEKEYTPHIQSQLGCLMRKPTKWLCAQRRPRSAWASQWVAKDPSLLHADSEDSDQTGQMCRLI